MNWHPYAKLFPMLPDEQIELLADDIRANGQRNPIIVDTHERIIDGRNRSAACLLAGKTPIVEVFAGNDRQILTLVCSLNIHRRHLSDSQRELIAAEIANMPAHVTAARPGKCHDAPSGASSAVTQDEAAGLMNVKKRSVQRAAKVIASAVPEIQEDVRSGKVKVATAEKVARLAPAEQQKARASGYKDTPVDPPACAMKYAEQAVTILSRIRDDDDERLAAFNHVSDWLVEHFQA